MFKMFILGVSRWIRWCLSSAVPVPVMLPVHLAHLCHTRVACHFQLAKMATRLHANHTTGTGTYRSVGRLIMNLGTNYNNICVFHFDFSLRSNSKLAHPPPPWHLPMTQPPRIPSKIPPSQSCVPQILYNNAYPVHPYVVSVPPPACQTNVFLILLLVLGIILYGCWR